MAALTSNDRADVHARWMREDGHAQGITKAEGRAAVDAIDQWVEDNTTSFNNAIPLPARTALTAKQKARLLLRVVERRFEVT